MSYSKEMINLLFKSDGIISNFKEDYSPRQSQIDASLVYSDVLDNGEHMILEGPCGFGKTFAYLAPLFIKLAKDVRESLDKSNYRAVIATNGISLSEQLFYKDAPFLNGILSELELPHLKIALFKGRQNFICARKASLTKDEQGSDLRKFIEKTNTGDVSEFERKLSRDETELTICTNSNDCLGGMCSHYSKCYYAKQKARLNSSHVIITNYHILYSDYKTGGYVLPDFNVLIMDEAHEAVPIFREFNISEFSYKKLSILKTKTVNGIMSMVADADIENIFSIKNKDYKKSSLSPKDILISDLFENLLVQFKFMEVEASSLFERFSQNVVIKESIPKSDEMLRCLTPLSDELEHSLEKFKFYIEELASIGEELPEKLISCYSQLERAVENIDDFIKVLRTFDVHKDSLNYVYYFEKSNDEIKLCMKPVDVSEKMNNFIFSNNNIHSALLTSATLSTNNSFSFLRKENGIDLTERNVSEFIGDSPFNLKEQQLWYLHKGCKDGNTSHYDDVLEDVVDDIVNTVKGGILFLCTSNKNMNRIYEIVTRNDSVVANNTKVILQGHMSTRQAGEAFKEDKDSILVATRSFFTGIDVPGDALRCVVIDKFPFPSPGDPIVAKLSEKDKNSFKTYSIPVMTILLKQAIGRGVRSVNDKCVISFLDNRMKTARYAKGIADSFTYEKTSTRDIEDVKNFLYEEGCL